MVPVFSIGRNEAVAIGRLNIVAIVILLGVLAIGALGAVAAREPDPDGRAWRSSG